MHASRTKERPGNGASVWEAYVLPILSALGGGTMLWAAWFLFRDLPLATDGSWLAWVRPALMVLTGILGLVAAALLAARRPAGQDVLRSALGLIPIILAWGLVLLAIRLVGGLVSWIGDNAYRLGDGTLLEQIRIDQIRISPLNLAIIVVVMILGVIRMLTSADKPGGTFPGHGMTERAADPRPSFIAEARRAQIVEATIATLDEIGYANASLAQIAKRAGISTALISYHFKDRDDLMDQTLMTLAADADAYVLERTRAAPTAPAKLQAYIAASLAYQGTHPKRYTALLEIIFHARTPDNVPYYRLSDEEEEPLVLELQRILRDGQASGEFRAFSVPVMANAIRGAINEYLLASPSLTAAVNLESYGAELTAIFDRAILADVEPGERKGMP